MAKNPEIDLNAVNLIGSSTIVKGDIICESDIRIDGEIVGNLVTQGRLIIGTKGKINGDVKCKTAEIEGAMNGNLEVLTLLALRATSNFVGDITTAQLMVEPGATFVGTCKMDRNSD